MISCVKTLACSLCVLGAAVCLHWCDVYHVLTGGAILALAALPLAWWHGHRRTSETGAPDAPLAGEVLGPAPGHAALVGLLWGAVTVACLALGFAALGRTPIADLGYGRDRTAIEQKVTAFRNRGEYDAAANIMRTRLGQPISRTWAPALARDLTQTLIEAAQQHTDLGQRRLRLKEAHDLARQYGQDERLTGLLLDQTDQALAFRQRLEVARAAGQFAQAADDLRAALRDEKQTAQRPALAQNLEELLLEWGQHEQNLDDQAALFEQAVDLGTRYGLSTAAGTHLRQAVQREIALRRQMPDLPRGTQAGFLRISTETFPPALVADLWVEAGGIPILGLKPAAFEVTVNGQAPKAVALAPVRSEAAPTWVVVLLDTSGSMQGAPLEAAKTGMRVFVRTVSNPSTHIKVITFNHRISPHGGWCQSPADCESAIDMVSAGGETALLRAVATALDELAGCAGEKRLVLFSDGRDTVGGPSVAELVARCRQGAVQVHTIGLRGTDLDVDTLQSLAQQTGGQFVEAQGPQDIVERYLATGRNMRQAFYRLVITPTSLPDNQADLPVAVTVAGRHDVGATRSVHLAAAP